MRSCVCARLALALPCGIGVARAVARGVPRVSECVCHLSSGARARLLCLTAPLVRYVCDCVRCSLVQIVNVAQNKSGDVYEVWF